MKVLTARIPEDLLQSIRDIETTERAERTEVVRRLLDNAVREWKLERALKMISSGDWTLRKAAHFADLTYHELLDKMAEQGIDSGPTLTELRKSLAKKYEQS